MKAIDADDVPGAMDQCYAEVDKACASEDIEKDHEYSFCRGHTAKSGAEMSFAAWNRIILWKQAMNCDGLSMSEPKNILQPADHPDSWWYQLTRRGEWERQQKLKAKEEL